MAPGPAPPPSHQGQCFVIVSVALLTVNSKIRVTSIKSFEILKMNANTGLK